MISIESSKSWNFCVYFIFYFLLNFSLKRELDNNEVENIRNKSSYADIYLTSESEWSNLRLKSAKQFNIQLGTLRIIYWIIIFFCLMTLLSSLVHAMKTHENLRFFILDLSYLPFYHYSILFEYLDFNRTFSSCFIGPFCIMCVSMYFVF